MIDLSDQECLLISLAVSIQHMSVTEGQTAGQTQADGKYRVYA